MKGKSPHRLLDASFRGVPALQTPGEQGLGGGDYGINASQIPIGAITPDKISTSLLAGFQVYDDCIAVGGLQDMSSATINSGVAAVQGTARVNNPGVITVDTGALATGGSEIVTNPQSPYGFVFGEFYFRCGFVVRIPTLSDGTNRFKVLVGFSDTFADATSNAVALTYSDNVNSGNWLANITNTGSTQTIDTGVAPVAGAFSLLEIVVAPDGASAYFFIDRNPATTRYLFQVGGLPTVAVPCKAAVSKSLGTASRKLDVDAYYIIGSTSQPIVNIDPSVLMRLG